MTAQELREKLTDRLHDPDGDATIVGYDLIAIVCEQREALEKISQWTEGGRQDLRTYQQTKIALAATDAKLKEMVDGE